MLTAALRKGDHPLTRGRPGPAGTPSGPNHPSLTDAVPERAEPDEATEASAGPNPPS